MSNLILQRKLTLNLIHGNTAGFTVHDLNCSNALEGNVQFRKKSDKWTEGRSPGHTNI